ncbi:MAG: SEL1-like repeat protein [Synergistaceae bacterium]|nr:SEL1-like repeat protein [Synergistaceae bacterium]
MREIIEGMIRSFKENSGEVLGAGLAWCVGYLILSKREVILSSIGDFFASLFSLLGLGRYYDKGEKGLPQDYTQAVYWYRKATEQGDKSAKWVLKRLGA